jgi:hypothetical protein
VTAVGEYKSTSLVRLNQSLGTEALSYKDTSTQGPRQLSVGMITTSRFCSNHISGLTKTLS